nr:putative reverse transcriptase domain-containing protein [Tanacetum cinerariifolium]
AVSKISEGVKSIEINLDNSLFIDDNNNNPDAAATSSITSHVEPENKANATHELEESNVDTLKPDIHNLALVEADDKSVKTSKIISEQADEVTDAHLETNITLPEEAESRIEISVATNVDKSKEANITTMEHSDVETGLQAEPTVDHVEQLEVPEVEPPHDIPKIENADEPNKQEEIMQEISAIKGVDVSSEVTDASEHQADIKERSSPRKNVSKNSNLVVELEKVKKEMKSMEAALLGAARQAQAAPFEALYGRKCRSPVYCTEVRGAQILGPELIQKTIEKIVQIKQGMQAARNRQKSYADLKRKPMEFQVRDKVMLKKCHADEPLAVPLDGLHFDDKLHFVEEPVEIIEREVRRLKRS